MTDDSENEVDPYEEREERLALRRLFFALTAVAVGYGFAYWWFS